MAAQPAAARSRNLLPLQGERLEGHERIPCEFHAAKGKGDLLCAVRRIGHEGHGGGDHLAVRADGLAGLLVHERARERVLLAGREPRVGDGVHDGRRAVGHGLVIAVVRIGRLGVHAERGLGRLCRRSLPVGWQEGSGLQGSRADSTFDSGGPARS